jgi:branched-chain amino acid transport system permease protein
MAFDVVASTFQLKEKKRSPLERTILTGLIYGSTTLYFALVGIVRLFHERWIIADILTLGQGVLLVVAVVAGFRAVLKTPHPTTPGKLAQGAAAGATAAAVLAALVIFASLVKIRFMFVAAHPQLFKMLTMDQGTWEGSALMVLVGAMLGLAGALLFIVPDILRRPIIFGLIGAGLIGLFQELLQSMLQAEGVATTIREFFFTFDGLKIWPAALIFVVFALGRAYWLRNREGVHRRYEALTPARQRSVRLAAAGLGLLFLILLPIFTGQFIGQVLMIVGLFILMGMGLNLEIGLAGLLDLGFVAFYAIGAYSVALLTAVHPQALADWSFWAALPMAIFMTLVAGVLFGVPVLRIRGDYLAVATLGLGEIIRILVLSDAMAWLLGGSQGILAIPKPQIGDLKLSDPTDLFYLTLVCAGFVAYCAWRLENSRLGRAWTAIRDDEDVAEALGINLVNTKLLAYGLGAAFAGVAGAIFAVMLGSVFPHSFQLLISINILALIIVGGMGSLPGVVVGAFALMGTPEMLREFGEFRFLFYGVALVAMMRFKPEGLWPSAARRREMAHDAEDDLVLAVAAEAGDLHTTSSAGLHHEPAEKGGS